MNIAKSISTWAQEMDGVFTLADLRVVLGDRTEAALYKRLNRLTDEGELIKVKRGLYAVPDASLEVISHRIDPGAYISTGTVLARYAVIGSIPVRKVQAIKLGRPRDYECPLGVIEHLSIAPHLYFGFQPVDGRLQAEPEKALLDVCYYAYRGRTFSFDPASDVNIDFLDRDKLAAYLSRYESRFVDFCHRLWEHA